MMNLVQQLLEASSLPCGSARVTEGHSKNHPEIAKQLLESMLKASKLPCSAMRSGEAGGQRSGGWPPWQRQQ